MILYITKGFSKVLKSKHLIAFILISSITIIIAVSMGFLMLLRSNKNFYLNIIESNTKDHFSTTLGHPKIEFTKDEFGKAEEYLINLGYNDVRISDLPDNAYTMAAYIAPLTKECVLIIYNKEGYKIESRVFYT